MIPKFRAWCHKHEAMYSVRSIDLALEYITVLEYDFFDFEDIELMQCTGLKDQNGVEIFEGDILYFDPYETHSNDRVVEHIDGAYHGRLIRNGYSKLLAECVYETKVIGNIYENPELLEVAE